MNEDVIQRAQAAPLFKPERLPRIEQKDAAKVYLKVINSKSVLSCYSSERVKIECFHTFFYIKKKRECYSASIGWDA